MTSPIGFGPSTTTGIVLIIKPDLSKSKFKTKKDYFKIKSFRHNLCKLLTYCFKLLVEVACIWGFAMALCRLNRCMCLYAMQMEPLWMRVTAMVCVTRTCPSVSPAGRAVRAARTVPHAGCRRTGFLGLVCSPSRGSSCSSFSSACWWPTGIVATGWVRSFG